MRAFVRNQVRRFICATRTRQLVIRQECGAARIASQLGEPFGNHQRRQLAQRHIAQRRENARIKEMLIVFQRDRAAIRADMVFYPDGGEGTQRGSLCIRLSFAFVDIRLQTGKRHFCLLARCTRGKVRADVDGIAYPFPRAVRQTHLNADAERKGAALFNRSHDETSIHVRSIPANFP